MLLFYVPHDMPATTAFYRRLGFTQIVDTPHYARFECPEGDATFSLSLSEEEFKNGAIIYFLGVFGPILVIFVLNVCMTCLAFDRRVSRATLVGAILPVLTLGGAMALGLIRDPGLMTVLPWVGDAGRGLIVAGMTGFLIMTYGQARRARDVIVASLAERDEAVRMASQREAMFLEARFDLERALQVGGLGRFSDQVLGSYQLGEVIGRGGMGEVYRAQHVETGAAAAVKMLLPEVLARPDYVRRFLEEVRIAASLHSPHVVEVLAKLQN